MSRDIPIEDGGAKGPSVRGASEEKVPDLVGESASQDE